MRFILFFFTNHRLNVNHLHKDRLGNNEVKIKLITKKIPYAA